MASKVEAELVARNLELEQVNTRLMRTLKKKQGEREELRELVYQAARDAAVNLGRPQYVTPPPRSRATRREAALLHLTDWQDGKQTVSYNMEVCRRRVMDAAHRTIRLTERHRKDVPVDDCHVMLGGDMIENVSIFPGQVWEVEAGAYEQVFHCAHLINDVLTTLAAHFSRVHVHWVTGNHGRIARKGDHPKGDNWDRFIYGICQESPQPPNVVWYDTVGWHTFVVIGAYRALLVHGDQVGAAPVTVQNKVTKWASGTIDPFLDCYLGHRHHVKVLELPAGGRLFMTGSTESGSEYGREVVGADGPPSQRLNFVDPVRGRVTAEYLLYLDGER